MNIYFSLPRLQHLKTAVHSRLESANVPASQIKKMLFLRQVPVVV